MTYTIYTHIYIQCTFRTHSNTHYTQGIYVKTDKARSNLSSSANKATFHVGGHCQRLHEAGVKW